MNEKSFKKSKIAIRGIQRNGSDSNQWPSDSRRRMDIFWENTLFWITGILGTSLWNIAMTKSFAFRILHLIKSYDWHTDTWQTKSLSDLRWGRRIFSIGGGSLVREEFLKQPVGNSNTYDLKLENAMSGEFNVMIVQTLETWTKWAT